MTTDIGKVNIDYLEQPGKVVHEFGTYLASNANRMGNRSALGFYLKDQMEQAAEDFLSWREADEEEVQEVKAWIDVLSWPEVGYLALVFNW